MQKLICEIDQRELVKGIKGRYFHTDSTTIGFVDIEKGAILPAHSHMHEQTTQVTEGKLEMTIDGITQILEPGTILLIPSNAVHSAVALTDCKVTDIFCPVREDYK
ncbi:cupin domain-containing protein [Yeosuana sp. MJ-SS3]|uniref:Cupin domain-containing protein n=1 Tax=Gilvirhabdus luticola TaxID=3079858 RepID=A0ABU3U4C7_9FLAO|nr:cupin domain-containing protein [Yeosuana sp. MJ-SS3]MDU8885265.1 cupin domain-containing protein [Yeosuana sp. MJ-SS3]